MIPEDTPLLCGGVIHFQIGLIVFFLITANAHWQTQERENLDYAFIKLAFLRFASSLAEGLKIIFE